MFVTEEKKTKTMGFNDFNKLIQERFDYIQSNYKLFRSSISGDKLWEVYLSSFRPGDNPVFRDPNSTSHTCNKEIGRAHV